ncbi:MAG: porin family protein [Alphaproteobacteria bacterium]|nr:porin family protein [Alphaproteobacteria bacterium]
MKKVLLATLAIAAFVATEADACVKVRPYVSAKAGYTWANAKADVWYVETPDAKAKIARTDQVWTGALAAGIKVCAFRTELEYNHWGVSKDESSVDGVWTKSALRQQSLMLNGYFDIPTKIALRPYVGAGLGVSRLRGKVHWAGDDGSRSARRDYELAWQVGAGFGYNLTKNLTLDVGYRYVNNGNVKILRTTPDGTQGIKYHARNQEVLVGLRYTF